MACEVGLIWPIRLPLASANQRSPSGPLVIWNGALPAWGRGNSAKTWVVGLNWPILLTSVNQMLPSGPLAMPVGLLLAVGTVNSVMTCVVGLICASLLVRDSVNQRLPSGPVVISSGPLLAVGIGNSLIVTASRQRDSRPSTVSARRLRP